MNQSPYDAAYQRTIAAWTPTARTGRLGLPVALMLFGIIYYQTFVKLIEYWAANDMYSYAFMVPIISAGLIWVKRPHLADVRISPSFGLGALALAAGLTMFVVGRYSSTNLAEELSLIVTVSGLTLVLFGRAAFRCVAFSVLYLLAMIPFWDFFTAQLHPTFQLYSAIVGVNALKLVGIPVLREGVLIELPNVTLEVAEACSGINYLIAVLCIGVPLTYLFVRRWSKRLFIVCLAAVIAVLSNAARVAMVSLFAYYGIRGADGDIHGPFALFRSLLVSGIGFAALFALVFRMADKDRAMGLLGRQPRRPLTGATLFSASPRAAALAIGMLAICAGFEQVHTVTPVPLKRDLHAFPSTIGRWEPSRPGSSAEDAAGVDRLDFDQKLARAYSAADGTTLRLFIGYLQRQEQNKELAGYGIRTVLTGREHFSYTVSGGKEVRVNDFLATTGTKTFYTAYCYIMNGRVVTDDYLAKLYTAWDSIVHGRSDGALVVVQSEAGDEETLDVARDRVRSFLEGFFNVSQEYLPSVE